MLRDDLLRSDFRRHVKRNFLFEPRRFNHSRLIVFDIAEGAWNDIAYAVNHSDAEMSIIGKIDFNGVFGNEFRLGRHYCSARGRLGQFVRCSFFFARVLNIGYNKRIHKSFYKCGFTCSDRSDNTYIDVAARPCLNVLVNACTCS